MTLDISKISNDTFQAQSLGGLLLATPQNDGIRAQNGKIGLDTSILFHYEGEQSIVLESDITDHFTENNDSIQDHIALRPITISTQGFIGELNNVIPPEAKELKEAEEKLIALSAFAPELSVTAQRLFNAAEQAYRVTSNVNDIVQERLNGIENQTEQQKYYTIFEGYWKNRTLFTVQTPWARHKNMAIKTLRAVQDADDETVTTFEVSFKQMRFSDEAIGTIDERIASDSVQQGRSKNQAEQGSGVDGGIIRPSLSPETFASRLA